MRQKICRCLQAKQRSWQSQHCRLDSCYSSARACTVPTGAPVRLELSRPPTPALTWYGPSRTRHLAVDSDNPGVDTLPESPEGNAGLLTNSTILSRSSDSDTPESGYCRLGQLPESTQTTSSQVGLANPDLELPRGGVDRVTPNSVL